MEKSELLVHVRVRKRKRTRIRTCAWIFFFLEIRVKTKIFVEHFWKFKVQFCQKSLELQPPLE